MKSDAIIGRKKEIEVLNSLLKSSKSEFAAIYGRRRVGKSFLVEEVFRGKIVFKMVGTYIKDSDDMTYKSR
ncbi:MAG: ATP-binding protein, partial [Bacteroidales bacterium]|nr:ATP-binding protein [Bacteroidales bacterium]